jgi:hypothetical protein
MLRTGYRGKEYIITLYGDLKVAATFNYPPHLAIRLYKRLALIKNGSPLKTCGNDWTVAPT